MTLRLCHYVILLCGEGVHFCFFEACTLGTTLIALRYTTLMYLRYYLKVRYYLS